MTLARQLSLYIFFSLIASIAFVYGTGFEWTAGVKTFFINILFVLSFEKLMGDDALLATHSHKKLTAFICFTISAVVFWYGFHARTTIDYTQDYDVLSKRLINAVLLMFNASAMFVFGGVSLMRKTIH